MRKLIVLMLVLCFAATAAEAVMWGTPEVVIERSQDSRNSNIAVRDGKVAIVDYSNAYHGGGAWGSLHYHAYTYAGNGALTQIVSDEYLGGASNGLYGSSVSGLALNAGGEPVVASIHNVYHDNTIHTRASDGTWSSVAATNNTSYDARTYRESMRLDSAGNAYFVYTAKDDDAANGIIAEDIVLASAPSSTTASGSWTQTVLSRPALPFTTSAGTSAGAKIDLDQSGAIPVVQTAYMAHKPSPSSPGWFSADGTATYDTGIVNGTTTSRCDIALDASGNPMVAAFGVTGVEVAFYDGVTPYTVSTVTAANILNVGWYNTADCIDIELDGQGRPVLTVTSVNNAYGITEAYIDYYVYEGGVWTGENVLTVATTDWLRNTDLTFDENGRAFMAFSGTLDGGSIDDLYVLSAIPEPATMIMLLGGAIGMAARRRRQ